MLKKETKRRIISILIPPLGTFLLKLIYLTCKVRFHGCSFPDKNTIYAGWHGEIIMSPFCFRKMQYMQRKICVITSKHFDGRLIGEILKKIAKNSESVEGSSSKGGSKALMAAIRVLKKPNHDLAIAPDGPRGPRHEVAQGIVALSQRLHVPIVTINCRASSRWEFKSWDRMFLPKPFSKIEFFIGEPFYLEGLSLEQGKQKVKERLMENAHV